jgi:hypothetical protein
MWASILSKLASVRGSPEAEGTPGSALVAEPEPVEVELTASVHWFLRLRWLAVIGVVAATLFAVYVFAVDLPVLPILAIAGALAAYNLALTGLTLRIDHLAPSARLASFQKLAHLHIALDLVALTVLLHYSGGVENPLFFFYVFHVVVAGIFLSRLATFAYAVAAAGLFSAMTGLEALGLAPHYHLQGFAAPDLYRHGSYLLIETAA